MKTGVLATVALLALYAVTMTIFSGWNATEQQFRSLWYLMVPLAVGFGTQVGLYAKMKAAHRSKPMMATSGTTSATSMLACCAHHATNVLPFLGISGISLFLSRFQAPLLAGSIAINVIGIAVMLKHLKKISL